MPDQTKPKGILRNRAQVVSPPLDGQTEATITSDTPPIATTLEPFDRHAVLENTLANAKIHTIGNAIIQKHKNELEDELQAQGDSTEEDELRRAEHLKWNEANLYLNEQEKSATMKITEPKTPFQGAVGDSEYYKPDEEDDEFNLDGDGLLLGEPESSGPDPTIQSDRIIVDEKAKEDAQEEQEPEHEETPEERHKRFEQMRKNHYFMKGAVLHKHLEDEDDDEEE